ncbi:MAG: phosphotriesterase-related protein [Proteobacteria bacterium]|nr:phosphotriesterase-related protein [Pseudomonadota bacterium]
MGSKSVNTVSGAVSPDDLGITLMHEHLVFGYPGWYGDCSIAPFDRDLALTTALDLMEQLKDCGLKTYVDATPNETGRNPELYREIAEKSGVNIVCSTGFYTENSGASAYFKFRNLVQDGIEQIYEMFMREITVGIGDTGIKAGVIKLASSKDVITDYERMFFVAAARAQKETGVPIITHTQEASMGPEQAQLLIDEGADPKQVMIGHMSDSTDVHYHLEVLNKGVYDAFDRMGLQVLEGCPLDIERYAVVTGLIAIGHIDRIIISHDYIAYMLGRSLPEPPEPFKELLANYHPTHLFKNIVPFLKSAGISDEQVNTILVDNPRRLFAGE